MCRGAEWEAGGREEGRSKTEKGTKTDYWNKISYQLKTGLPRKEAETLTREPNSGKGSFCDLRDGAKWPRVSGNSS